MAATGSEFVTLSQLKEFSQSLSSGGGAIDSVYPIGSIYMSVNSTDPSTLFGGTWERIQDRFLLAAGSSYAAGSVGGEVEHKLSVSEMPSHNHTFTFHSDGNPYYSPAPYLGSAGAGGSEHDKQTATSSVQAKGGGQAHNNMPPYLTVYMWKRTA